MPHLCAGAMLTSIVPILVYVLPKTTLVSFSFYLKDFLYRFLLVLTYLWWLLWVLVCVVCLPSFFKIFFPGYRILGWQLILSRCCSTVFCLHCFWKEVCSYFYLFSLEHNLSFSLAALKVFFLYLVFRNLTKCVQGWFSDIYSVSGSQSLLHLWVPVFQQIKKSLAIVSSKNFLLSHSVSSPSRTLDDTLLNCLTLLYRLRMFCPVFFSVSLSFTTKIIMMVWSLT